MGALAIDAEDLDSDVYLALGLKRSGKGTTGTPRILTLLSSFLEKSVKENQMQPESKGPSCFLVAYIYLDRFGQHTDVHLTSCNVHRLLLTSVMVAAKFIDDLYFNNAYYAHVGGVSTAELNKLEMEFLFSLDFRLQVSITTFQRYCSQLQKESADGHQVERPLRACGIKESWSSKSDAECAPTIAR
ncbi:Cyclin-U4-1 [Hibiscus syriacus]|uniref:Cyclin-U4-1 n=1 Tax=Hibiscus syriacus TaxID=106335 RepID=A0A6A2YQC1_HIBSY|nr:Cyclin-U4-1 [Hibiscus syriacus]